MDNSMASEAGFILSAVFERKKEIMSLNPNGNTNIDPFYLLKEVAQMSSLRNQALSNLNDQQLMKQQESLAGYNSLVLKNYEDTAKNSSTATSGYDPQSLAEKMSKLKFAKAAPVAKDQDWFSKLNSKMATTEEGQKTVSKKLRSGLTEEEERQIQIDMIPHYIAKQQELQPEYEHIKNIGRELKLLKEEYGVVIKQAPAQATTSFMNRRGSQARQYELITSQMRSNRMQRLQMRQDRSQVNNLSNLTSSVQQRGQGDSRSQSRQRSVLNDTPLGPLKPKDDKNHGGLQSLSEASGENTQRESQKNTQTRQSKKLRKSKSKSHMRKSVATSGIQNDKPMTAVESNHGILVDAGPEGPEDAISSFRKSENSNICSKCGFYGCKGDQCDQNSKDASSIAFPQRMNRDIKTANQPLRRSALDNIRGSQQRQSQEAWEKGNQDQSSENERIVMTEGGVTFKANAKGLIDIRETEELIKNQKQNPVPAIVKRESEGSKTMNETRISLESRSHLRHRKTAKAHALANKDLAQHTDLTPSLENNRISKSSYLNTRKAAAHLIQPDKTKKHAGQPSSNLPVVSKVKHQSLGRKPTAPNYTSNKMLNLEKHDGSLNSKFKLLSSLVIMNFNESGSIQPPVQTVHYATQNKQGQLNANSRGKRKQQAVSNPGSSQDPPQKQKRFGVYQQSTSELEQVEQLVSATKQSLIQKFGTTNPLNSNNNSMMKKFKTGASSIVNVKKAGDLSSNTQMEGGCTTNTQRASRVNLNEVVDIKRIISNQNKIIEKQIFNQSPNLAMDNEISQAYSRTKQVCATGEQSKVQSINSIDASRENSRQKSVGASFHFISSVEQPTNFSLGNIKLKGQNMFKDQKLFQQNEDKIKEWHINNHMLQHNDFEASRSNINRDRMSRTIQNKTYESKFNIEHHRTMNVQRQNQNSKEERLKVIENMPKKNFSTAIPQPRAKGLDVKQIYQEVPIKRSTLSPIKPKSKPKASEQIHSERNEKSIDSSKGVPRNQSIQPQETTKKSQIAYTEISNTIFSAKQRLNKTDRHKQSKDKHSKSQPRQQAPNTEIRTKEIQKQFQTMRKAEDIIYPQTIYCTSDNQRQVPDYNGSDKFKRKSAGGHKQHSGIINPSVFPAHSFEREADFIVTQSIQNDSLSMSPKGIFKINNQQLQQKLNACHDPKSEILKSNETTKPRYVATEHDSAKSPNQLSGHLLKILSPFAKAKISANNRVNPYSEARQQFNDRYQRCSAYDSTIMRNRTFSAISPLARSLSNELQENAQAQPASLNIDLSKIRKNILDQKPNLDRITSKFKIESRNGSMANNIHISQQSIPKGLLEASFEQMNKLTERVAPIQATLKPKLRSNSSQRNTIPKHESTSEKNFKIQQTIKQQTPVQAPDSPHVAFIVQNQLQQDADQELVKINNLLKKKVKEKKTRDKLLQDSIIHDKIHSLAKNQKLSKKEKNQLMFLKKLESKLARQDDSREGGTTRRKQKAMLSEHVAQRVQSQNASFILKGQAPQNGSKIGFHNLIFNDLKFQTELIHFLKKPKSNDKKERQIMSNIEQQKLLYGDDQIRKEVLSSKHQQGRNSSAQNSQQMKKSTTKKDKLITKDPFQIAKKHSRHKLDQSPSLQIPQQRFYHPSGTVTNETPPLMEHLIKRMHGSNLLTSTRPIMSKEGTISPLQEQQP